MPGKGTKQMKISDVLISLLEQIFKIPLKMETYSKDLYLKAKVWTESMHVHDNNYNN